MKIIKRFLGGLLALCLVASMVPAYARAEEDKTGGLGDVVTEMPDDISLTVEGLEGYFAWKTATESQHDGKSVLEAEGVMATLAIKPSEPCYFVFDYIFVGTVNPPSTTYFSFLAYNSSGYNGGNEIAYIAPGVDELSDNWSTGVVDCTDQSYGYAIFSFMDMASSGAKAYISNIRIYKELPKEYTANVTVNYSSAHGSLTGAISKNGQKTAQVNLADVTSGEAFNLPLDSVLYEGKFTPVEGASFSGFKITTPSGQNETVQEFYVKDSTNKKLFYFTEPGNYTIDVLSGKAADEAEMKVYTSDGGSVWTEAAKPHTASYGDLYVEPYGTNQTWKIELKKGEKKYDSVTVTDNGSVVPLTGGDTGVSCYELTPGTEIHQIDIVYKQTDCSDVEKHLVIWPTLDFTQAYGGDGKNEGMTDDFWKTNNSGTLAKLNGVDAKNGTTGTYSFLYDPTSDNGAGKDDKHPVIFSSRESSLLANSNMSSNTFTFDKGGLFSFDYMVYNGNNEHNENDDSGYLFTVNKNQTNFLNKNSGMSGWTHVETEVNGKDTVTILFNDTSNVGTWLGLSNISFLSDKVMLTVQQEGNGTVTGGGEHYKGQTVTLEATPSDGYAFVGWYKDGTLLSTDSVLPYTIEDTATLTAKFAEVSDNAAQIGEHFYGTLDEAFEAAKSMDGDTVVRLLGKTYTLNSNVTVPAGETLLLPCSISDTGYSPVTGFNPDGTSTSPRTGANGTQYFNLTIPSNVTLTVEGTVLVNAVTGRPAAGHLDMDVNGGYAQITLDGKILVKEGGVLDVCGYVKDSTANTGTITAETGGEVRDLYIVRNWRGGSQAFHIFPDIYPMNQVDMHNIEVKTVINAGASFVGTVKMYASGSYYYTRFPQVDQGNGLIQQSEGTVTRTYDAETKRETWVLDGTGKISSSILNIVGMDLSTGTFLYPIDGDMDFVVKGDWNVVERLKLMPGAKVDLTDGTLTLAEMTVREPRGNEIVFYDSTFADIVNGGSTGTAYPTDRGDARMTIYGGTTTNVNCAFGGKILVDKDATPDNPAVINFMEGKAVSVTSQEANGYLGGYRDLTFEATLGGYKVESGKTYSCYYEDGKLVIEVIGETATQEAVYSGQPVTWSGEGSVEYLVGGKWGSEAPKDAGEYPVRKSLEGGTGDYTLAQRVGTITITPKVAVFALETSGFTYDGSEKSVTVKVTNAAEGDTVTPVVTGDTTGTDTGTYTVTVTGLEGASKDNYTIEGATTTLTWNIAPKKEDAPTGLGFEYAGNITGLTAGQNYKVNGTEVTAGAEGRTAIQDGWFGTTVSVVKSGDGVNTADSDGTELAIPARPDAPEVSTTQASSSTAEDGSITVKTAEGNTYEYRKGGDGSWSDVAETGKIEKLAAGSYEVRVKGTDRSFPGAVKAVTVTYYIPATSTPSTSTTTTTNPDGSTTKTTTKSDGTVTEKVTRTDGSATERTTTPEGVTGTVDTNAKGEVSSAEVVIPESAAAGNQDVVTAPVEVPASKNAESAPEISVKVQSGENTKVEIPVTEYGPGTVAIVVHEDGTEEIVRDCVIGENGVILNVEGDVTLKIVDNTTTFTDIEPVNHWATEAVEFVAARELFNGTGDGKFTPGGDMTRGMLVTVLYRLNYEPETAGGDFADVSASAYYADAVAWAEDAGVVDGYGNGSFGPNDNVTREQIVTILYRYAEKNGYLSGHAGALTGYADADKVSGYAKDAMSWAIGTGLVRGVDDTHLAPANNATRAEVATILMRFCENIVK